jgi:hypothetical protein
MPVVEMDDHEGLVARFGGDGDALLWFYPNIRLYT